MATPMPWLDPLTTATRPARLRGADDLAAIVLVLRYKESILVSANGEEELDMRWYQRKGGLISNSVLKCVTYAETIHLPCFIQVIYWGWRWRGVVTTNRTYGNNVSRCVGDVLH